MKNSFTLARNLYACVNILIIFMLFMPALNAQNSKPITITYIRPPLNMLRADDMWNFTLKNNTDRELRFYLYGTLKEERAGLIATGKTVSIKLNPSESKKFKVSDLPSTPDISYAHPDPRYKEALMRAGTLPDGEYEICVTAMDASTNDELSIEQCMQQEIKITEEAFVELLTPGDGETLDSLAVPLFSWTAPIPKPAGEITYTLKIYEANENQNSQEVIATNKVFNEIKGLKATSYNYKITDKKFNKDKKYYWWIVVNSNNQEILTSGVYAFAPIFLPCVLWGSEQYPGPRYCHGGTYSRTTSANGTMTWSVSPSTGITTSVSGSSSGTNHVISFSTDPNLSNNITYTVTYSFNYSGTCTDLVNKTFTVQFYANPQITLNNIPSCLNTTQSPINISNLITQSPDNSGTLTASGNGISGSGANIMFNPSTAGAGLHTITVYYERPSPPLFPMIGPRGCQVTKSFTIFVNDPTLQYTSLPQTSTVCQGISQQIYIQGIPANASGFNFQWYYYNSGSGSCPVFNTSIWSVLSGVNSPSFNTDMGLPMGKHCFVCVITDPCGNIRTSSVATVEVGVSTANVQLSSQILSVCSTAPAADRTVNVTLSGYTGTVTWSTTPPVTDINTDPYIYSAELTQTTIFTTTFNDCSGAQQSLSTTVDVLGPPPPALVCIQPHIIPGVLPACCEPYLDPCSNHLTTKQWCDANITLLRSDDRTLFPQGYTVKWYYFDDENFDFSLNLSQFENNNISSYAPLSNNANWTAFIPGGDNRFWNTNPLEVTRFFKVEITGSAGCGTLEYYGAVFVVYPVPPFDISEIDNKIHRDIPCDQPLDFNFDLTDKLNYSRPSGFDINYTWSFTPYGGSASILQSGAWSPSTPFPGTAVNVTQEGVITLTLNSGCYTRAYSQEIFYGSPNFGVEGPCCVCNGAQFELIASPGFTSYTWTASEPGVTFTNNTSDGQRVFVTINGITNVSVLTITANAVQGGCPVVYNKTFKFCQ
ncbi:MAG TPA: hypothetical protein VHP32_01720 [Ignavibacteria bacterium]|nr:hypothetical protein [Ignavibacteria bacterium]